jgi:hypothetical protein
VLFAVGTVVGVVVVVVAREAVVVVVVVVEVWGAVVVVVVVVVVGGLEGRASQTHDVSDPGTRSAGTVATAAPF